MKDVRGNMLTDPVADAKPCTALDAFAAPAARRSALISTLDALADAVGDRTEPGAQSRQIAAAVREHSPSVTLLGQVKAGKTAVANLLIGRRDLLPIDVNPWTSAVTSVHLSPGASGDSAVFRFFDQERWDALVARGGRLGELARRSGASDEAERIAKQVEALREKARARLGKNFEKLLGGCHSFDHCSPALVERYVCAGETEDGREGRYADMTRTADLTLATDPHLMPLTVRDTPGVNDPFLLREAMTIEALGDTDICVIVLSAQQALSTSDVALVRMLAGLGAEQIILFVNRTDGLERPESEIPEISRRIRETLARQGLPAAVPVIFGSALWGQAGLSRRWDLLTTDSMGRFERLAATRGLGDAPPQMQALRLSGLAELAEAIAERMLAGRTAEVYANGVQAGLNLARQGRAMAQMDRSRSLRPEIGPARLVDMLDTLLRRHRDGIYAEIRDRASSLRVTLFESVSEFAKRECDAMLADGGRSGEFQADSSALRLALKTQYDRFAEASQQLLAARFRRLVTEIEQIYATFLPDVPLVRDLEPPIPPRAPPPVQISVTMAIDMRPVWWRRFFGRSALEREQRERLTDLIHAEAASVIDGILSDQVTRFAEAAAAQLRTFTERHVEILIELALAESEDERAELLRRFGWTAEAAATGSALERIEEALLAWRAAAPPSVSRSDAAELGMPA